MNCCRSKGPHLFIASVDASRSPITNSYCCAGIRDECIRLRFGLFQSSPYHRACRPKRHFWAGKPLLRLRRPRNNDPCRHHPLPTGIGSKIVEPSFRGFLGLAE